ncbi:hypothetical protein NC651_016025 [Populus alba x Populus x berolinensis]|nr:hypothetical protein NC651_016025 [Populus alba x Populus x berolinensis]
MQDLLLSSSSKPHDHGPQSTHCIWFDFQSKNSLNGRFWSGRKLRSAAFMLNLFNLQRLS